MLDYSFNTTWEMLRANQQQNDIERLENKIDRLCQVLNPELYQEFLQENLERQQERLKKFENFNTDIFNQTCCDTGKIRFD